MINALTYKICLWINASTFCEQKTFLTTDLEIWQAVAVERHLVCHFTIFSDITFQHCFELINITWTIYVEGELKNVFAKLSWHKTSSSRGNGYLTPFLMSTWIIEWMVIYYRKWMQQCNNFEIQATSSFSHAT